MFRRRIIRSLIYALLIGLLGWFGGFALFLASLPDGVTNGERRTDAIVVLTGGRERIPAGIDLLNRGLADRLFVSGVHETARLNEVVTGAGRAPAAQDDRIELGHEARDTRGNARETAAWASLQEVETIRLVTAFYHMPRSLLAFDRTAPHLTIVPHPVFPEGSLAAPRWRSRDGLRLLAAEYTKYLFALAGMGEPA